MERNAFNEEVLVVVFNYLGKLPPCKRNGRTRMSACGFSNPSKLTALAKTNQGQ